ncbi:MAG TPA: uroporphyrinogen decarboxylase family protein, partial [Armatimonadota bacterium]
SKELFMEFIAPYYRCIIPELKKHGIIVIVDSDGDIAEPVRWFLEVGVDGVLPLERQAGIDAGQLRTEHPNLRMIGHFDKMTMHRGEDAMRAEFERLLPTAAQGGFVIGCDHQTPPGVSYQDYRLYLRLFREYAERAGRMSGQPV